VQKIKEPMTDMLIKARKSNPKYAVIKRKRAK
jgi:hypothetical protein